MCPKIGQTFVKVIKNLINMATETKRVKTKICCLDLDKGVIVKTCSDSLFSIGQKNCQLFVAKLRNFLDSHNRMVLY